MWSNWWIVNDRWQQTESDKRMSTLIQIHRTISTTILHRYFQIPSHFKLILDSHKFCTTSRAYNFEHAQLHFRSSAHGNQSMIFRANKSYFTFQNSWEIGSMDWTRRNISWNELVKWLSIGIAKVWAKEANYITKCNEKSCDVRNIANLNKIQTSLRWIA